MLSSRCPGASHRRAALERRKTSRTQTEIENENGTTIVDLPGTLSPETDCSGTGTVPAERSLTSASLPAWTEEPGLDNPAFEESAVADSMCRPPPSPVSHLCFQLDISFLPTTLPTCNFSSLKKYFIEL